MLRWLARFASSKPGSREAAPDASSARAAAAASLDAGDLESAEAALRLALSAEPEAPELHFLLADVLRRLGRDDEALASVHDAAVLDPAVATMQNDLGSAFKAAGKTAEAERAFRRALELDPALPEAHFNLGALLHERGEALAPRECYEAAIALRPDFAEAHLNLGHLEEREGRGDAAQDCFRRAVAAAPDFPDAHFNLALQALLRGDHAAGWREYEWRLRMPEWRRANPVPALPEWRGEDLAGRPLLLYTEQGHGDALQFVRFTAFAARAAGGPVLLMCRKPMRAFLATAPGISGTVSFDDPLPDAAACLPLLSLPFVLRLEDVGGASVPYLRAAEAPRLAWRERLAARPGRKVALAWSTGSRIATAQRKSVPADLLEPLSRVGGVHFFTGQPGPAAGGGLEVTDLSRSIGDFADNAALVAEADLVITIDTALAHLAGALGRPAWVLLPALPDWRWGLAGERSAWYPAAKLFRQPAMGDWRSVTERVAAELRAL